VPDTDNDGIKDDVDKCPTVAGIAKYQGCPIPDTDGDGIDDEKDKCPTVPGIPELLGCPRPDLKGENVLFAVGKYVLVASGKKELDIIVDYLKQYTGFNATAEGHTDNTGSEAFNLTLSEKRAEAAKNYLVSKGVEASRINIVGKGEAEPIADNNTAEGRRKNRRVQFRIDE
jgi:outer membrane protein OmpA-like peptidoglycan-associated protein